MARMYMYIYITKNKQRRSDYVTGTLFRGLPVRKRTVLVLNQQNKKKKGEGYLEIGNRFEHQSVVVLLQRYLLRNTWRFWWYQVGK